MTPLLGQCIRYTERHFLERHLLSSLSIYFAWITSWAFFPTARNLRLLLPLFRSHSLCVIFFLFFFDLNISACDYLFFVNHNYSTFLLPLFIFCHNFRTWQSWPRIKHKVVPRKVEMLPSRTQAGVNVVSLSLGRPSIKITRRDYQNYQTRLCIRKYWRWVVYSDKNCTFSIDRLSVGGAHTDSMFW